MTDFRWIDMGFFPRGCATSLGMTSRQTIRNPAVSLMLPNGPGDDLSVDNFRPPRGDVRTLLFADRC